MGLSLNIAILDVPLSIWKKMLHPLSGFSFGRRSIWHLGRRGWLISCFGYSSICVEFGLA
ncbi:hypothetical protein SOVF_187740 [Spinacia oleracea]|nr:hypothetical protein SOVF_187740 [Spinacia oleracea]